MTFSENLIIEQTDSNLGLLGGLCKLRYVSTKKKNKKPEGYIYFFIYFFYHNFLTVGIILHIALHS